MKKFRIIIMLALSLGILSGTTSCVVLIRDGNGGKRGWFKNTNNPHHPYSTNPGKAKGNRRSK